MVLKSITKHFNLQLTLACLLIAFSQFNYGFDDAGFSSTQAMNAFNEQFGVYNPATKAWLIEPYFLSLLNSLPYIGFATGLLVGSLFSARFGRRKTMAFMSFYTCITTTIVITASSKQQILAGRILHYLYTGMELSVVPVFQSEIVPAPVRGLVVGTYQLSLVFGRIVMAGVCYKTSTLTTSAAYRIPFGLFYVVPVIVFALVWFIPESPRWLLTRNRIEEAQKTHHTYRAGTMSEESIAVEFKSMHQALIDEPEQGKAKELVKGVNKKRTAIVIGVAMFQQITGQAFASQYGAVYIKSLGTINPFAMTLGNSCISACAITCTLLVVDKIGRRRILLLGSTIQCLALITMGSLGIQNPVSTEHKAGIVACLSLFVFGFGAAWGPITFTVITELPALRLRDKSQRVGALTNILFNFLVNFTIPYLLSPPYANLQSKVGFIYGSFSAMAFVFVYFCVPECKGRSLEEIDRMFQEGVPVRKFRKYLQTLPIDEVVGGAEEIEKDEKSSATAHVSRVGGY